MNPTRARRAFVVCITAISLAFLALLTGCQGSMVAGSTAEFPEQTGFVQRKITVEGQEHTVWAFVPKNYRAGFRYPAVLFLHGLFEAGNGGDNVLAAGLGPVIA